MSWTYSFHRFEDRTAFEAALIDIGWDEGVPTHEVALDVLGLLYRPGAQIGTDAETGEPLHEQLALEGWHVNAAWKDIPIPEVFAAAAIPKPATPDRVFAGS